MVREYLLGQMVDLMQENTLTTKSKDMVYSLGLMAENMKANGTMESNMEKEFTLLAKMKLKMVNGKMVKELNSQKTRPNEYKYP